MRPVPGARTTTCARAAAGDLRCFSGVMGRGEAPRFATAALGGDGASAAAAASAASCMVILGLLRPSFGRPSLSVCARVRDAPPPPPPPLAKPPKLLRRGPSSGEALPSVSGAAGCGGLRRRPAPARLIQAAESSWPGVSAEVGRNLLRLVHVSSLRVPTLRLRSLGLSGTRHKKRATVSTIAPRTAQTRETTPRETTPREQAGEASHTARGRRP